MNDKRRPRMNYENYERAIVEAYSIELKNFPGGHIKQPGALPRQQLQALVAALQDNNPYTACHWAPLSETALRARIDRNHQREEQGERVYVPRKKTVKTVTKGKSSYKSAATVDSDDDGSGSDGGSSGSD